MTPAQSSRDPNDCTRNLQDKLLEVLGEAKRRLPIGDSVIIAQTYRNEADQLACWQCGRDNEGNIIDRSAIKTYKKPGTSEHGKVDVMGKPASRAVDLLILRHGRIVDSGDDESYKLLGKIGKEQGLEWSGDWENSFESAHFQLTKEDA